MMNKKSTWFVALAAGNSVLFLLSLLKIGAISGSILSSFSFGNMVGPLFGLYLGLPAALALYASRIFIKGAFLGSTILSPLSLYLPTMFASAYWARNSVVTRLLVPLACIVLFNVHSVGVQAFYYSFYWLIPVALYFVKEKNIFMHAVASTFIAHAVGSVLWLYWLPMQPAMFAALMPVVIIERFVMASGMVVVHTGVMYAKKYFSSAFTFKKLVNPAAR